MQAQAQKPPSWAIVGTIIFVIAVPGTVVIGVPYWITGWHFRAPMLGTTATRLVGAALFLVALPAFCDFVVRFVREGFGTPAPVAPPSRLVRGGVFARVRNPGYISVAAMIVGQALIFGSVDVLIYAALAAICFHLFVVFYEEPTLRAQFGAQYDEYCRSVPRWLPRFRRRA
ncbi:MAG: isoprenylcysteine carboxylmethyltransferase family protein [Candidatus Binataceae bacterium]